MSSPQKYGKLLKMVGIFEFHLFFLNCVQWGFNSIVLLFTEGFFVTMCEYG